MICNGIMPFEHFLDISQINTKRMSFMKVTIDRSGCISCGICESICPKVFRLDDEGLAEVLNQPDESSETGAAQAATDCPTAVIIIEE